MAGNVTFIIGNGFDLSLGLQTSYRQFFDYVSSKKLHPENRIYKHIATLSTTENWIDFEIELGNYTKYIEKLPEGDREEESKKFHDDLVEVADDLASYIEKEEERVGDAVSQIKFEKDHFYRELPQDIRPRILPHIDRSQRTTIRLITLNYTGTLKKLFPDMNVVSVPGNYTVHSILHVHGTLDESMTIGVGDESQLSPAMSEFGKRYLIKSRSIESTNDGRMDALRNAINYSDVIVLFGSSIGKTDNHIWKLVLDWLAANGNRYLVIHSHAKDYTKTSRRHPVRAGTLVDTTVDKLLEHSNFNNAVKNSLRSRIFVVPNTQLLFAQAQDN